ncbi:hypothetical protein [Arenimonas composti]|uniref:Bacterial Pleckstrin homology domain-containing protein n=1 Tax=Arenimonas composti TR7-09 = DSM 18010 TaxID=1121013 RepID=A0A091BDB0_9GAMM|nr:hypothetical protein [Arenimonas composti]KFN49736.1 hypothetical protein P873_09265 [Arenimonas composti TR7-09 = DSM 18010]
MAWRNFALPPLGKATVATVLAVGGGVPLGVAVLMAVRAQEDALTPLGALAGLAMSMLIVCAILLPLLRRRVAFDGRSIRVSAAWFSRTAAVADFDLDKARIVDLRERTELRPWLKTLGFSLPGLRAGHYRSRDRRKVFCLVTDPAKVLVLSHADGTVWLLSFRNPQAVLDVLRSVAG